MACANTPDVSPYGERGWQSITQAQSPDADRGHDQPTAVGSTELSIALAELAAMRQKQAKEAQHPDDLRNQIEVDVSHRPEENGPAQTSVTGAIRAEVYVLVGPHDDRSFVRALPDAKFEEVSSTGEVIPHSASQHGHYAARLLTLPSVEGVPAPARPVLVLGRTPEARAQQTGWEGDAEGRRTRSSH
jgi:hypothetical protein